MTPGRRSSIVAFRLRENSETIPTTIITNPMDKCKIRYVCSDDPSDSSCLVLLLLAFIVEELSFVTSGLNFLEVDFFKSFKMFDMMSFLSFSAYISRVNVVSTISLEFNPRLSNTVSHMFFAKPRVKFRVRVGVILYFFAPIKLDSYKTTTT